MKIFKKMKKWDIYLMLQKWNYNFLIFSGAGENK